MRKASILAILLIILTTGSIAFAENQEMSAVESGNAYIPSGTNIAVELVDSINSKKTFIGEVLEVNILEDIVLNNTVVIEKGSNGYVMVSNVQQAAEWGKGGGIELQPQYVKTANYIKVPLLQGIAKKGDSHNVIRPFALGTARVGGATTLGVLGRLSGLFLFYVDPRPGKDTEIPAGTKFIVTTNGDVDLQVPAYKLQEAMTTEASRKTSTSISTSIEKNKPKDQSWIGTYNTNRGRMTLSQSGKVVTGTYERSNGTIEGRVKDGKLIGTWTEDSSEISPSGHGFFEFTMSSTGGSVMMLWRHDYSSNWTEDKWAARLSGW